jgi:type I restriction enzyme S subunit
MNKWQIVSLGEVCDKIQYGYTESAIQDDSYPKFLRITDIVNETIDWQSVPNCKISEPDLSKYRLSIGDIVVARTGNTTGYAKLIRSDMNAVFASYLIRFKVNHLVAEPGFVGRLIESNIFKAFVNQVKGGAAQGNANATTLSEFRFKLPPLPTQHKIASILSAYDDLIENNLSRIKLLEEAAFLEYRLLLSASTLEERLLGDLIEFNYGSALKTEERVPGSIKVFGSSGVVGTHNKFKVDGPGIIVGRKGNVGSVFWSDFAFYPIDTVYYVSTAYSLYFIYHNLKYDQAFVNSDAAVPGLNRKYALGQKIRIPIVHEYASLQRFDGICENLFSLKRILEDQNEKLKEARDILLPRLMNQTIEV